MVYELRLIAAIVNSLSPAYEMKNPLKNRGQWIGLFYLTMSDISADIYSFEILNNHLLEVGGFKARGLKVQQYRQANAAG